MAVIINSMSCIFLSCKIKPFRTDELLPTVSDRLSRTPTKQSSKPNFILISRHFRITYTPYLTEATLLPHPQRCPLFGHISGCVSVCGGAIKAEQNYNSQLAKHLHQPTKQHPAGAEWRWILGGGGGRQAGSQAAAFFASKKNDSWKRPETPAVVLRWLSSVVCLTLAGVAGWLASWLGFWPKTSRRRADY